MTTESRCNLTDQQIIDQYRSEKKLKQAERFAAYDALPKCLTCDGTGQVDDECGWHVAVITCHICHGTGKN